MLAACIDCNMMISMQVGRALLVTIADLEGCNPWSRVPQSTFGSVQGVRDWLLASIKQSATRQLSAFAACSETSHASARSLSLSRGLSLHRALSLSKRSGAVPPPAEASSAAAASAAARRAARRATAPIKAGSSSSTARRSCGADAKASPCVQDAPTARNAAAHNGPAQGSLEQQLQDACAVLSGNAEASQSVALAEVDASQSVPAGHGMEAQSQQKAQEQLLCSIEHPPRRTPASPHERRRVSTSSACSNSAEDTQHDSAAEESGVQHSTGAEAAAKAQTVHTPGAEQPASYSMPEATVLVGKEAASCSGAERGSNDNVAAVPLVSLAPVDETPRQASCSEAAGATIAANTSGTERRPSAARRHQTPTFVSPAALAALPRGRPLNMQRRTVPARTSSLPSPLAPAQHVTLLTGVACQTASQASVHAAWQAGAGGSPGAILRTTVTECAAVPGEQLDARSRHDSERVRDAIDRALLDIEQGALRDAHNRQDAQHASDAAAAQTDAQAGPQACRPRAEALSKTLRRRSRSEHARMAAESHLILQVTYLFACLRSMQSLRSAL